MDYRIDGKGKTYTQKVTKQAVPIVACVENTLIHGTIHLTPENRLKDELNNGEVFLAITHAQVLDAQTGRVLHNTDLLIINKQRIAWIFPSSPRITDTDMENVSSHYD